MSEYTTQFLANADRFTAIVESVPDWSAPSPCTEWTAGQVLDHVIDSERDFVASHGADLGDRPSGTPAEMWGDHLRAISPHLSDQAWMSTTYDGWTGPTTVGETIAKFFGIDLVVHGWDIATSSGEPYAWTDTEMDQAEAFIASMGPALYMDGVCQPAIEVPEDSPRQVRLLALAGRAG